MAEIASLPWHGHPRIPVRGTAPAPRHHLETLGEEDRAFAAAPALSWDGAYASALFISMLFILELGSMGAALFCAATLLYCAKRIGTLPATASQQWYLLAFPLLALLSVMWSSLPVETLKHGAEFALTVIAAMLLCSARNQKSVLLGIFWAFLLYTAVSLAFGHMVDVGDYGARALSGLSDSKNEEADMAATGLVVSAFLFIAGMRIRAKGLALLALAAGLMQAYVTVRALSAGAIAGTAAALLVLVALITMRKAGRNGRIALLAAAVLSAVLVAALLLVSSTSPLSWAAQLFGKDPTLTGRTYLWFRARDFIADHPLLGGGYGAFWQHGNLDAEGLWRYAGIATREGFNFHNTLYDVLVSLGWIGALVLGLTFLAGLGRLLAGYVRSASLMSCFWLAVAAYLFIRMPTECVGINEFYFATVMLFALLGAGATMRGPSFAARGWESCRKAAWRARGWAG